MYNVTIMRETGLTVFYVMRMSRYKNYFLVRRVMKLTVIGSHTASLHDESSEKMCLLVLLFVLLV